jgi:hypothetical protein
LLVLIGACWVWAFFKLRTVRRMTASMRVSDVTSKLGMSLEVGDPTFNLAANQPRIGVLGWLLSQTPLPYTGPATEIRARGQLGQRASELYFYSQLSAGWRWGRYNTSREYKVVRQCRLGLTIRTTAEFELMLRHSPTGTEAERERPELPPTSFGDLRLDQRYLLFAASPDVATRVSHALRVVDNEPQVHILGQAGRMVMSFTLSTIHYFAGDPLYFLHKLDAFAQAVENPNRVTPSSNSASPSL